MSPVLRRQAGELGQRREGGSSGDDVVRGEAAADDQRRRLPYPLIEDREHPKGTSVDQATVDLPARQLTSESRTIAATLVARPRHSCPGCGPTLTVVVAPSRELHVLKSVFYNRMCPSPTN